MNEATIAVVNESTVVDPVEAWNIAWALNYQAHFHFGPRWFGGGIVTFVPGGSKARTPAGAWVITLKDHSSQEGALGWHDENGHLVPYTEVACKDAIDDGSSPCEVASHEMLEMLVDPHVNMTALDPSTSRLYAAEVCDPVQGKGYDVGAPEHRKTGMVVAAFVLPSYWDPNTTTQQVAYPTGALPAGAKFQLAPQGYFSFIDLNNLKAGWQQSFGAKRKALPPWATRSKLRNPVIT